MDMNTCNGYTPKFAIISRLIFQAERIAGFEGKSTLPLNPCDGYRCEN